MQATPEHPLADAPPLACPRCGTEVEDGQLACLNCGAALRFRDRRLPDWRLTAGIVAVLVLLAGTAIGVGVGTLVKDEPRRVASAAPDTTAPTTPSETPTDAATPPAATTPSDGTAQPPPGEGANEQPVPPASGGDPSAAPPATATTPSTPTTATTPTTTTATPTTTTTPTPGAATGGSTGSGTSPDDTTASDDTGGGTDLGGGGGARTARWPRGDSGFTVVLASVSERADARRAARQARSGGISAGVLDSDDFSSLRPGYWVAFAGRFDDVAAAERAAERYQARGFPEAYPREVRP